MNKKAEEIKPLDFLFWLLFLAYVLIVIVLFTTGFVNREMDIRDAEARIFANKLIYSPVGISYTDAESGRTYTGTVDLRRIDTLALEKAAILENNQFIAAKITVYNMREEMMREAIYNEVWYARWRPLTGKRGSGASSEIIEKRYVTIYDGDTYLGPGILEMRILVPNA